MTRRSRPTDPPAVAAYAVPFEVIRNADAPLRVRNRTGSPVRQVSVIAIDAERPVAALLAPGAELDLDHEVAYLVRWTGPNGESYVWRVTR